jgi:hypothetical protein
MKSRFAACVVLLSYVTHLGCTSVREISPAEVKGPDERIVGAVYTSGQKVEFEKVLEQKQEPVPSNKRALNSSRTLRYAYLDQEARTLTGTLKDGQTLSIPTSELTAVRVQHFSWGKSLLLGLGLFLAGWGAALLITYS